MSSEITIGAFTGTGAAINIPLGWIPDYVKCVNLTDGDTIDEWFRGNGAGTSIRTVLAVATNAADGISEYAGTPDTGRTLAYTSGGTYVLKAGDTITGALSATTALVTNVTLASGTFAGGDAVGVITVAQHAGKFQAENLNVGANLNVATISTNSLPTWSAPGFTAGTDISESGKVINFIAMRNKDTDYNDVYP